MNYFAKRFLITAVVLFLLFAFVGCSKLEYRTRTLPERIQSIYIPMAKNKAYEYGLEESLTNALIEEFLADGRLDVVPENRADVTLLVTITRYLITPKNFESDEVPYSTDIDVEASVKLLEGEKPLLSVEALKGAYIHVSDVRRTIFEPTVDAKNKALRDLANSIVNEVLCSAEYNKPK